jgi:hypothetical protein
MRKTRRGRLDSARATGWVQKYEGKNIIRGYANWFGVDLLCAVIELRALGVSISAAREAEIKATIEGRAVAKKRRKQEAVQAKSEDLYADSDGTFMYIAGYTRAGFPYGVTRDELGEEPPQVNCRQMKEIR